MSHVPTGPTLRVVFKMEVSISVYGVCHKDLNVNILASMSWLGP